MEESNLKGPDDVIASWKKAILEVNRKVEKEFAPLTLKELYYNPSPDTWSIAENLQHLVQVNKSYFPIFNQIINHTFRPAWSGRFAIFYNTFGKTILRSVNEDRKKKIKTFILWKPTFQDDKEKILDNFLQNNFELMEWMEKLKPFLGIDTVIHSPANKIISYTLDQSFDIIISHEKRHLNQAKEIKDHLHRETSF